VVIVLKTVVDLALGSHAPSFAFSTSKRFDRRLTMPDRSAIGRIFC